MAFKNIAKQYLCFCQGSITLEDYISRLGMEPGRPDYNPQVVSKAFIVADVRFDRDQSLIVGSDDQWAIPTPDIFWKRMKPYPGMSANLCAYHLQRKTLLRIKGRMILGKECDLWSAKDGMVMENIQGLIDGDIYQLYVSDYAQDTFLENPKPENYIEAR